MLPYPAPQILRRTLRHIGSFSLISFMFLASQSVAQTPPGGAPKGPVDVGTVVVETRDVPYVRTLPGRAVAYETGEIRARVSGVVEEILYAAGDALQPGDPMFKIEDTTYVAALASANAALAGAMVQRDTAQATVDRYKTLQGSAVSKADLQNAEATAAAAAASYAAAKTALDVAQLDLDRTIVRSPIAGIAGISNVSIGALVTANQADALATVTRLDPIYIDVSDSSAGMLRVRAQIEDGSLQLGSKVGVALVLESGDIYDGEGTVVVLGNVVSATTGTFDLRVQFDNPKRLILPGQFLRVKLTLGSTSGKLVPQRATGRNSDGTLTVFVAKDGVARKVALTTSGSQDNAWIVTSGVEDGDLVIVDGLTNLRDGAEINPVPVTIDADGVVHDATSAAADAPAATTGNN
ncbi:MAG: efflux transporter periplasmic adaptor subunit [Cypionkella sp.]|uniref:efflux RND transporter periplasmic adaptor subunit n=1 Tax=Cypionkella sp. TaxID=2811411 RepID=UPI0026075EF5|nr:efflux RND transporter periplasmic adaptor subunit [Cypionkella sp.]MDB5658850.1 efflux transporter periplasmic adaptor subunit [Cypionkella sp.]